jgi:ribosomal protein L16 Arg81 hydroxylase
MTTGAIFLLNYLPKKPVIVKKPMPHLAPVIFVRKLIPADLAPAGIDDFSLLVRYLSVCS